MLVGELLSQLVELKTPGVEGKFRLTHTVACSRAETVEIAFVAEFHLQAVDGHLLDFDLHGEVAHAC